MVLFFGESLDVGNIVVRDSLVVIPVLVFLVILLLLSGTVETVLAVGSLGYLSSIFFVVCCVDHELMLSSISQRLMICLTAVQRRVPATESVTWPRMLH